MDAMTSWAAFSAEAPSIAARGRALLERSGIGEGLLATVRGEASPRIHPVHVGIVDGLLLTFVIVGSAKAADLAEDGRYALHAHQDPASPDEFLVRGRAAAIPNGPVRSRAAAGWSFEVDDGYDLYELGIEHAVFGERASPADWPPRYTSWRSARG
jgi:hypothetical protein